MSALCGVTAILTSLYFKHMNSKKLRDQFSEKSNALRLLTVHEIGDRHPGTWILIAGQNIADVFKISSIRRKFERISRWSWASKEG